MTDDECKEYEILTDEPETKTKRKYRHYPDWYREIRYKCKHKNVQIVLDSVYDQSVPLINYYIKLYIRRFNEYHKKLHEMFPENDINYILVDAVAEKPLGLNLHEIRTLIGYLKLIKGHYLMECRYEELSDDLEQF